MARTVLVRPPGPRLAEGLGSPARSTSRRPKPSGSATSSRCGTMDGGDVLCVGETVYVGRSARTNDAGIEQIRDLLEPLGAKVLAAPVTKMLHLNSTRGSAIRHDRTFRDSTRLPGFALPHTDTRTRAQGANPCMGCGAGRLRAGRTAGGMRTLRDRPPASCPCRDSAPPARVRAPAHGHTNPRRGCEPLYGVRCGQAAGGANGRRNANTAGPPAGEPPLSRLSTRALCSHPRTPTDEPRRGHGELHVGAAGVT